MDEDTRSPCLPRSHVQFHIVIRVTKRGDFLDTQYRENAFGRKSSISENLLTSVHFFHETISEGGTLELIVHRVSMYQCDNKLTSIAQGYLVFT